MREARHMEAKTIIYQGLIRKTLQHIKSRKSKVEQRPRKRQLDYLRK
jgi:hypothetical protein